MHVCLTRTFAYFLQVNKCDYIDVNSENVKKCHLSVVRCVLCSFGLMNSCSLNLQGRKLFRNILVNW